MSVLKSLKGTFHNVQQDIVDGFRALTSLESSPRHEKVKRLQAHGITLDCGADILYRYQKEWSELHNYTADTAKKAEDVDNAITDMFTRHSARWESACQLEEQITALPAFTSTVSDMIELMDSLQADFQKLEEEMDRLQNLCEEETMEKEKISHVKQLAAYKKAKNAEAFSVKAKLWNLLKEKSKEAETKKSHDMKERQEAFLDAFASDMEYYRKHGRTDKLPSVSEFPKVSSLSEISIEEDKKALDDFLSSTEEGMFIEDDYTADYGAADEQSDDFPEVEDVPPIDFDSADPKINGTVPVQNSHPEEPLKTDKSEVKPVDSVAETETPVPDSCQETMNGEAVDSKTDDQHAVISADT